MRIDKLPIHSDPEIMGGTPVFIGTRVPFYVIRARQLRKTTHPSTLSIGQC